MISYGRQSIDDSDIKAVVEVLKSDYLTQGPAVNEFEKALAAYCSVDYCVALSNGTAALHLAVAALGIEDGREGITSPITFTASSNSMLYNGVKPVFADIDKDTFNITPESISKRINDNTELIIPVHLAGQPCRMKGIGDLAKKHHLRVIEDAAHAIGSSYEDGGKVGSCKHSDMTIFSFHPVKTITTGEGGAITTNNEALYKKLILLRSHGITKDRKLLTQNPGPWYYEMHELGFNYRLCDIQAALGVNQLKRLDHFKAKRRALVARYNEAFIDEPYLKTPFESGGLESCFHLYVSLIDFDQIHLTREQFMNRLFEKGIGTQVHYIPVHTQPYYRDVVGTDPNDCPVSLDYYSKALSLPLFPDLQFSEQDTVIQAIKELLKG